MGFPVGNWEMKAMKARARGRRWRKEGEVLVGEVLADCWMAMMLRKQDSSQVIQTMRLPVK